MNKRLERLLNGLNFDEDKSSHILSLTAFECKVSKLVQYYIGSQLSSRYHLGSTHKRTINEVSELNGLIFQGHLGIYDLEKVAYESSLRMFHSKIADLRVLSGMHAVICTLSSITNPKDMIFSIDPRTP